MNNVSILGRTTREVDLRYSQTGTAVGNFTLAVNRQFKNQNGEREADFIRCIAFGKTAEIIAQYVKKGQQLGIEGRIQTGSYQNQEGQTVYTTDVVVNQFTFISESKGQQQGNNSNQYNNPNQQQNTQQQSSFNEQQPMQGQGQEVSITDSDLPF